MSAVVFFLIVFAYGVGIGFLLVRTILLDPPDPGPIL
jgi:hypothetical protein